MEIEISNKIRVKKAPESLLHVLVDALKIPNPKYNEAVQQGYSRYGMDPYIYNFNILPDNSILVPRGFRNTLIKLTQSMGLKTKIKDYRSFFQLNHLN